jgi:hypothetical protein
MDQWFENDVPVMATAVHGRAREPAGKAVIINNSSSIAYMTFTQSHLDRDYSRSEWMCLYRNVNYDDAKDHTSTKTQQHLADYAPRHRRSGRNNVVIFCDTELHSGNSTSVLYGVKPKILETKDSPNNSTARNVLLHYYDIQHPLICSELEAQELRTVVGGSHGSNIDKIGACIRFRGDHDRKYIPQWIEYHKFLGIDHFWVYMNEPFNMTGLYNVSHVTYVPFDVTWENHPKYAMKYFNKTNGFAIEQWHLSQEPAQTSCLYTAKQYGLDWIITTDVDEYVFLPSQILAATNTTSAITTILVSDQSTGNSTSPYTNKSPLSLPPLKNFLQQFDKSIYGCMAMNDNNPNELMIDYVWRRNMSISDYPFARYKQIYNVHRVFSLGIHHCYKTDQRTKKNVELHPDAYGIYIQHYKQAHHGVSARGDQAMIHSQSDLLIDTALRDTYRKDLVTVMKQLEASQCNKYRTEKDCNLSVSSVKVPETTNNEDLSRICNVSATGELIKHNFSEAIANLSQFMVLDDVPPLLHVNVSHKTAACRLQQYRFAGHFAHLMQQFYRCWSFWNTFPTLRREFWVPPLNETFWEKAFTKKFTKDLMELLPNLDIDVMQTVSAPDGAMQQSSKYYAYSKGPLLSQSDASYQVSSPNDMASLRSSVLNALSLTNQVNCHTQPRIAMINRKKTRHIINSREILDSLGSHIGLDYKVPEIFLERKALKQQVETLSNIDILITPHGAQETSIVFMPHCGQVLEILPENYYYANFFGTLAATAGLGHLVLYVAQNATEKNYWMNSRNPDFCLSKRMVQTGVEQLVVQWQSCCQNRRMISHNDNVNSLL